MKTSLLSAAIVILTAVVAHAQNVIVDHTRERRWESPGYLGYRGGTTVWGGYGGYGGFSYYSPGYTYAQGPLLYGGYDYGWGGLYGGMGYYGGYRGYGYRGGYFGRPTVSTDAAGPLPRTGPAADRVAEFTSAREIEEGRTRLKTGDYRGAVDQFRSAVASHTENPLAQAWFAVALAIAGDGKNADKALRAAAAAGFPVGRMALADGLRDEKERAKLIATLTRVSGDGSLAAAFALSLMGEGARLKELADKDPVAKKLLSK